MKDDSLKIMLVDDHPLYRSGTKTLIEQEFNHQVSEFACLKSSIEALDKERPDLIFLDLELPDGSGLTAADKFLTHPCHPKVFILTTHHDTHYIEHAQRSGLHGYLFKDDDPDSLLNCINSAICNDTFFLSHYAQTAVDAYKLKSLKSQSKLSLLTVREQQVLYLLAFDMTSKEIAKKLQLSFRTVQNHRANIKSKLSLQRNSQLLKVAIDWKPTLESTFSTELDP